MTIRPVVCLGGLHLDSKSRLAAELIPGTSNPASVVRTAGGVACNVARNLVRLEVPVRLISVVGDDDIGHRLLARVASEGVDVDEVTVLDGEATAGYTAVLDPSGDLAFGIADMTVYDRLDAGIVASAMRRHRGALWLVDANPAAGALAALADLEGDLALDPVSVAKAPRIRGLLGRAAVVFPDAAEAEALTGEHDPRAAAAALVAAGVERAVVTVGADGVIVADRSGVTSLGVMPSTAVVDVTGAGDALAAGYLAARARGEDDPVRWGLAAASLTVETMDTVRDDLSVEMVRERLG